MMMFRHLPASHYDRQPWKNGQGVTDEILLLPEGASRELFDLRISRAEISAEGLFSAFAGADRIITLIEGAGLTLDFGDQCAELSPLSPFQFDSGRTPNGLPHGGKVRVFNVMANRALWDFQEPQILRGMATTRADLSVVFALKAGLTCDGTHRLEAEDCAIMGQGHKIQGDGIWIQLSQRP